MDRALILGDTGKLGRALKETFRGAFEVVGWSRGSGLDAGDFPGLSRLLEEHRPSLVINAVALMGIEACEQQPERAFHLNASLPRHLARLSQELGFKLIHFSSDAVFDDSKAGLPRMESDPPRPLNTYGMTKFSGDCYVQAESSAHYVFRLSVLLGTCLQGDQFVEKMVARVRAGERHLRIAEDVLCSPSFVLDVAGRVFQTVIQSAPWGLYHTANDGKASLYELADQVRKGLDLDVTLERASHRDFAKGARRSIHTFLGTEKQAPLRDWREAVRAYCCQVKVSESSSPSLGSS